MPPTTSTSLFFLDQTARKHPQAPALVTPERLITYREYHQRVIATARQLHQLGVSQGDRVAILADNSPDYLVLLMALWSVGGVAVPVSTRWPLGWIQRALQLTACQLLVTDAPHRRLIPPDFSPVLPLSQVAVSQLTAPDSLFAPKGTAVLSADATIIFTSGSSGEPKAALHTLGNHYYSARGSNRNIPVGPGDRWLLSLPLYHVGGLAIPVRAALGGGAVVFPPPEQSLLENLERFKVTHLSLVATQLRRLLQSGKSTPHPGTLKAVLLGGSAFPPALIEEAWQRSLPIHTSYGSTEMASQITTTPPGAPLDRLLTSGRPLPYREVRIAPDGEIQVRGATLFRGYLQNEGLDPARTPDGWFLTGDLGELDEQGYLIVRGRKDNRFISGGENIQPEAIERTLLQLPEVEQATVVPVDDPEFGQRPCAFLKLLPGHSLQEDRIREHLVHHLPRFMIPDRFYPWPEESLPGGLKPNRQILQQIAREKQPRKK